MVRLNPEDYADVEDEFSLKDARGGGGGKKSRPPKSKTSKAAREEAVTRAQEKRLEEPQERILNVIEAFPGLCVETPRQEVYAAWVNESIQAGEAVIDDNTLEIEAMRSGKGAGGQNVNKVSSAVRIRHGITSISVRNQETRDQVRNKQKARGILKKRLDAHIEDWRTVLTGADPTASPKELTVGELEDVVLSL